MLCSRWWLVRSRAAAVVTWRSSRWSIWTQHRTQRVTDGDVSCSRPRHKRTDLHTSLFIDAFLQFHIMLGNETLNYTQSRADPYTVCFGIWIYIYIRKCIGNVITYFLCCYFFCAWFIFLLWKMCNYMYTRHTHAHTHMPTQRCHSFTPAKETFVCLNVPVWATCAQACVGVCARAYQGFVNGWGDSYWLLEMYIFFILNNWFSLCDDMKLIFFVCVVFLYVHELFAWRKWIYMYL